MRKKRGRSYSLLSAGSFFLLLLQALPFTLFAEPDETAKGPCNCSPPLQGPPGLPGENNFLNTFGSFYTFNRDEHDAGDPIPIELVNSSVNVTSISPTQVRVGATGQYFIHFSLGNAVEGVFANVAIFRNNVAIPASAMFLNAFPYIVTNLAFITPLTANDVLEIKVTTDAVWVNFVEDNPLVNAVLNVIKLDP